MKYLLLLFWNSHQWLQKFLRSEPGISWLCMSIFCSRRILKLFDWICLSPGGKYKYVNILLCFSRKRTLLTLMYKFSAETGFLSCLRLYSFAKPTVCYFNRQILMYFCLEKVLSLSILESSVPNPSIKDHLPNFH